MLVMSPGATPRRLGGMATVSPRAIFRIPLTGLLAVALVFALAASRGTFPPSSGGQAESAHPARSLGLGGAVLQPDPDVPGGSAVLLARAFGTEDDEAFPTAVNIIFPLSEGGGAWVIVTARYESEPAPAFLIPYETGPPTSLHI